MPRISQLSALTIPEGSDEIAIVDTSAGVTKKITRSDLLKGADLPNDTVTTDSIAPQAVTADKINLATLNLAYAQNDIDVPDFTTSSASTVQIPNLSVTPDIPAGVSKVKVSLSVSSLAVQGNSYGTVEVWQNGIGTGTRVVFSQGRSAETSSSYNQYPLDVSVIVDVSGLSSVTFNAGVRSSSGDVRVLHVSLLRVEAWS